MSVPEIDALERLLKEWEVRRVTCTPMERLGFFRLKKKGKVELRRGVYFAPARLTGEEFDLWFDWFYAALGIAREFPVTVGSGHINT